MGYSRAAGAWTAVHNTGLRMKQEMTASHDLPG